jgi:hypothetical protein
MQEIFFGDFRMVVIQHIREIEAEEPENRSTEWFLLQYLKRIEKNSNPPAIPGRMENSMRGFIRFYVDNIKEHSRLGERCRNIYEAYIKTLRSSKEKNKV